jgi:hypothetical protein
MSGTTQSKILKGLMIVTSGTFSVPVADINTTIINAGGVVQKAVTKQTDYLLCADPSGNKGRGKSVKFVKAESLHVPVVSEMWLTTAIADGIVPTTPQRLKKPTSTAAEENVAPPLFFSVPSAAARSSVSKAAVQAKAGVGGVGTNAGTKASKAAAKSGKKQSKGHRKMKKTKVPLEE